MIRISIKGNPSAEEQALILARLSMPTRQSADHNKPQAQRTKDTPWTRAARSEQLSRWPQGTEDRYWQT